MMPHVSLATNIDGETCSKRKKILTEDFHCQLRPIERLFKRRDYLPSLRPEGTYISTHLHPILLTQTWSSALEIFSITVLM